MNAYTVLHPQSWPRQKTFEAYRKFANPAFHITVSVEAEKLFAFARERGESVFLLALYAILRAANVVPQIRHRIVDGQPVEFERIAAMTPIMTEQELFRQAWCEYIPGFAHFKAAALPEIERAKRGEPNMDQAERGEDFLCASCVPFLHFDSLTQADASFDQTVPILAWGKLKNGLVPISVRLNHCFVDGLHAGRFFMEIEHAFANPETL